MGRQKRAPRSDTQRKSGGTIHEGREDHASRSRSRSRLDTDRVCRGRRLRHAQSNERHRSDLRRNEWDRNTGEPGRLEGVRRLGPTQPHWYGNGDEQRQRQHDRWRDLFKRYGGGQDPPPARPLKLSDDATLRLAAAPPPRVRPAAQIGNSIPCASGSSSDQLIVTVCRRI